MNIQQRVKNLTKKYKTRCPFAIAEKMNINILYHSHPEQIRGYYIKDLGKKFIVLNSNLPNNLQKQILAHELGHICLHKADGWYYFSPCLNLLSVDKVEFQANKFAWLLLFDKQECKDWFDGDTLKYAIEYGIVDLKRYAE